MKLGALLVIFFMPTRFALDLQLLGGVWMIQIFPAMIFGLYRRWFSGPALLAGWAVGMIVGTSLAWGEKAWTPVHALKWDIPLRRAIDTGLGFAAYNGLTAVAANLVVAALLSLAFSGRQRPTKPRRRIMTIAPSAERRRIGWRVPQVSSALASARMSVQAWRFCAGCRKR